LTDLFDRVGFDAHGVGSGKEALAQLKQEDFDVVLLDLRMPDLDGTTVLERARPHAPTTVFIIMTAYGTLDSAIVGIREGAQDYLLKPCSIDKVLQAVEVGLTERSQQRAESQADPVSLLEQALVTLKQSERPPRPRGAASAGQDGRFLRVGDILLDTKKQLVLADGHPLDLTPTEFDILSYLMQHEQFVVSPAELAQHLHDHEMDERQASKAIRTHIYRLRQKLDRHLDTPQPIKTVRGRGYRFTVSSD
jgi:DNA-binding response OmpR family regulator